MRSVGGVLISLPMSPQVDKPLKSVTHGQCDARPTVTFPAARHHRRLTAVQNYTAWRQRHMCPNSEQLAHGCYLKAERPEVKLTLNSTL